MKGYGLCFWWWVLSDYRCAGLTTRHEVGENKDKLEPLSVSHTEPHRWSTEAGDLHHKAAHVPYPDAKMLKRDPAGARGVGVPAGVSAGVQGNKWPWRPVTMCTKMQQCLRLWTNPQSAMGAASLYLPNLTQFLLGLTENQTRKEILRNILPS